MGGKFSKLSVCKKRFVCIFYHGIIKTLKVRKELDKPLWMPCLVILNIRVHTIKIFNVYMTLIFHNGMAVGKHKIHLARFDLFLFLNYIKEQSKERRSKMFVKGLLCLHKLELNNYPSLNNNKKWFEYIVFKCPVYYTTIFRVLTASVNVY